MKLVLDLAELDDSLRGGAVAIGNFDGVHLGHVRIVERLRALAAEVGGPSVVFTFNPHPVRILRPEQAPPPLTWTDRKAALLAELGIDAMLAYPTDEQLLSLTPREFFETLIRGRLDARALVEGPNFHFGRGRSGNVEVLAGLCAEAGLRLEIVPPEQIDGEVVSSSRVRALIAAGAVDQARRLLTRPYRLRGMVTHGAGRGARLGFATANLEAIDTLLPGPGVYAGLAWVDGRCWPAAINIGPNPTFGEQAMKVEAHLIGFHGPLYGQPLEVDLLSRLRDIRRFDDVEQLKAQLARDVDQTRRIAASAGPSQPE